MSAAEFTSILQTDSWFKMAPPALQQAIVDIGFPRSLRPGQTLFHRGEPAAGVFGVLEGRLAAFGVSEHGDEALQVHLDPVIWFGEMGLYDDLPRAHHVRAVSQSTVIFLPQEQLRCFLQKNPEYWFHFGILLTTKLRLSFFLHDGRKLESNDLRVARLLLVITQSFGPKSENTKPRLVIHQQEVAEMLGMSRQTVNQALQRLQAEGLLHIAYNKIEILDIAALQNKVHYENWLPVAPS
ncbi:MAG: Crp/Fnr family transcriptional regulator [Rubrivivax sp.]|nr:MAG: Crp/Fnr family transcriptional regulator [Rubrivivax sp.]